ncbi:hypothetical protein [Pseudomonas monteilii]|uniref:hypothetical protein n=1 Tax=Pseudomonas monteilii TaxID=76759 RepID=UPI00383AFB60
MAHWQFRPLNPNETSGASIADDNFADEERTSVEILVRETLQNPLDARVSEEPLRVEYKFVTVDISGSNFAASIFSDKWESHFVAGELIDKNQIPSKIKFLVIEDFGTSGLEGAYNDSSLEGQGENWNAFWFREGEGAKSNRSNGGAGQGKITLYLASQLRSVFALTKRASDSRELLFGSCRFKRNYKMPGSSCRWAKEARWGAISNPHELAEPILERATIRQVKTELGLARMDHVGTSFLIPLPNEDISDDALIKAVVNEFFFAISRGRLSVKVGEVLLDSSSVSLMADRIGRDCRLTKSYRDFLQKTAKRADSESDAVALEHWNQESKLKISAFDSKIFESLRLKFDASELVSVDFPVQVKKKNPRKSCVSKFRVFLQKSLSEEVSQELYVRQDLGIDGERRLKGVRTIVPVMGLTFIQDSELSDLLVTAEEPTHRNWNARRPKVLAQYFAPGDVLNSVRNAALRLAQVLSPEGKKDETALSIYFADPTAEGHQTQGASTGKEVNGGRRQPGPNGLPQPKPKPIILTPHHDGFEISVNVVPGIAFPIDCVVTIAYATVFGDSFRLWDIADFWIEDEIAYPKKVVNVANVTSELNELRFRLLSEESKFSISGFDLNRQLEIRVNYQEVQNGPDNHED